MWFDEGKRGRICFGLECFKFAVVLSILDWNVMEWCNLCIWFIHEYPNWLSSTSIKCPECVYVVGCACIGLSFCIHESFDHHMNDYQIQDKQSVYNNDKNRSKEYVLPKSFVCISRIVIIFIGQTLVLGLNEENTCILIWRVSSQNGLYQFL